MKALLALLAGGLSTCSSFTGHSGQTVSYDAKSVCDGVEVVAINHEGDAAEMVLTVWPEGQQVYTEERPVNTFQHDIRPFHDPTVVNDWQIVIQRASGEVLYTSRLQRALPCA